ncbi:MAG: PIG-L family deacetylase [Candidatus Hydrogenedentes bacterium]|nr:PIG-L family deacetylase [Candidatus Hydrogenedentota bacterium]
MSNPVAFAVAAHPDDVEFMMGGTMLLLGEAGYELHYMNVANGSMGTAVDTREAIVAKRTQEAREAAAALGAVFHEPLVDDLDIFYDRTDCRALCAVIRSIKPRIMLVQPPEDYMEDHMNAGRLAVSAAFYRGMLNYKTDPPRATITDEVTLYHALPYGLRDGLRRRVHAGQYVDISSVIERKRAALACHTSQKEWLDTSQGLDSYLITMENMSREVGEMARQDLALPEGTRRFAYAEGWRRHSHLGFCSEDADPLTEALGDAIAVSAAYEEGLNR